MMREKLDALIDPIVNGLGYELVGCELNSQGKSKRLRIYIDSEKGVNLDDCTRVSREISAIMDVEDPIIGRYHLEVSSPGLDRPLMKPAQFKRFEGRLIKVRLRVPEEGRKQFKGTLSQVSDKGIVLTTEENQDLDLAFSDIDKANLIPEF